MSVTIDDDLMKLMEKYPEVNIAEVMRSGLRKYFEKRIRQDELEENQ